ncbi:MAG: sugar O-acetyltransferase [Clostridiales bacterium]|jgi:maltose O-acetyltransferase|nr:sugar O-acetyltransferase [Clostridiales bacterium]
MTEKEKSLQGYLYNPMEESLIKEREAAKDLYFEYNRIRPSDYEQRTALLKKLLGGYQQHFLIEQPFYCTYGYHITLGEYFFANLDCTISDGAPVVFGDHVFIGPHVSFLTEGHAFDPQLRSEGYEYVAPIHVGHNVWICANVSVLPGVTIGDNCIIGAGSVVSRDIPAGSLAMGNPCRVVRPITPEDRDKFPWAPEYT